jgi:hypothetical protein
MFRNPFQRRLPRGASWITILLISLAVVFFGQMILTMAFSIAFRLVHLVIDVVVLGALVFGLFYGIRFVSRKTEP